MKFLISLSLAVTFLCCTDTETGPKYLTDRVVMVIVDGPRWSETWGDSTHANIPERFGLLGQGCFFENFSNNGVTNTLTGHTALSTGVYQNIANNGTDYPNFPGIFQLYKRYSNSPLECALIASKDKLAAIVNCNHSNFKDKYLAWKNCGVNGDGTGGYCSDSLTLVRTKEYLQTHDVGFLLVNFKDPDSFGHAADSLGYIDAIQRTDVYAKEIYNLIQSLPTYAGKTTFIITNDHGRHLNSVYDGFVSHGCSCDGCRKIECLIIGPDIKANYRVQNAFSQVDLQATVCKLLNIPNPYSNGIFIKEILK